MNYFPIARLSILFEVISRMSRRDDKGVVVIKILPVRLFLPFHSYLRARALLALFAYAM